jgi:hypothetical protein
VAFLWLLPSPIPSMKTIPESDEAEHVETILTAVTEAPTP